MQSPPTELLTNFFVIWEIVATKPTGLIAILAHEPECSLHQCVQYSVKQQKPVNIDCLVHTSVLSQLNTAEKFVF